MMRSRIKAERPDANLGPYEQAYRTFSWEGMEEQFTWSTSQRMNMVHEAIDCRADRPDQSDRIALIFDKGGRIESFTYLDLKKQSCKWANLLAGLGFEKGDRLFLYLDPCPELYSAMLACARIGVVFCPLYPTLGFDELEDALENAHPKGILTHPDLAENLPSEAMSSVQSVLLTEGPAPGMFRGESLVEDLLKDVSEDFQTVWMQRNDPLYMLYTSGSTGPPKGVVHAHEDMIGLKMTARYVLDVSEDTVLWTDGHPAWVTGTVYSTFGPWLCGATSVVLGDPFSASTWYRTLERHKVTAWYTTPSKIQSLMDEGEDLPNRYDFSSLGHISTAGETLGPELFHWVRRNIGRAPHDSWWMSETGMICMANFPSMDVKPGSMGKPVPGIEAAIIDQDGQRLPMLTLGQLALRPGWPAMMKAIWNDPVRYDAYFEISGWFLTGDMALEDDEGYFFHQGRMDDLITVGDKMVGPYEIERVLCRHPAVHEAAVISREAATGTPALKAFVTVAETFKPSARLNHEIRQFVKANLSSAVSLSRLAFVDELPKTRSGKLIRRVLRARELGLPGGDPFSLGD